MAVGGGDVFRRGDVSARRAAAEQRATREEALHLKLNALAEGLSI